MTCHVTRLGARTLPTSWPPFSFSARGPALRAPTSPCKAKVGEDVLVTVTEETAVVFPPSACGGNRKSLLTGELCAERVLGRSFQSLKAGLTSQDAQSQIAFV